MSNAQTPSRLPLHSLALDSPSPRLSNMKTPLGAGGGGCFLFYVKPEDRNRIIKIMNDLGLKLIPFVFENKGINSWKTRQVK